MSATNKKELTTTQRQIQITLGPTAGLLIRVNIFRFHVAHAPEQVSLQDITRLIGLILKFTSPTHWSSLIPRRTRSISPRSRPPWQLTPLKFTIWEHRQCLELTRIFRCQR